MSNHLVIPDIICNISPLIGRNDLLNLISTCKTCRRSDNLYFREHYINNDNIKSDIVESIYDNILRSSLKNLLKRVKKIKNIDNIKILKNIDKLTNLTFGREYIEPILKDVLPSSLSHLTFGHRYDQQIEKDILPSSLTHLTLYKKDQRNLIEFEPWFKIDYVE